MPIREENCFQRKAFNIPDRDLDILLEKQTLKRTSQELLYFGYVKLPEHIKKNYLIKEIDADVDNFFRLTNEYKFEQTASILTIGLRTSRFAPILFWEIFHILAAGGVLIDIDYSTSLHGTPLAQQDYLDRDYFNSSLVKDQEYIEKGYSVRIYAKVKPSLISSAIHDDGWSFGILTAGQSKNAEKMIERIFALNMEKFEVIVCGTLPQNVPDDERIRHIDLESPEPRGWISKKKNMIVDHAIYNNLCIMHDRFVFPQNFLDAMNKYGNVFSFLTFPQFFFPDSTRTFFQRYPDYQVLLQDSKLQETYSSKIYHGERIFHPQYNDFSETSFCCGGVYIAKKSLWGLVSQDESLYHCEWEDVLFGLESQQKGVPHRVNPFTIFESLNAHPLLLTNINVQLKTGKKKKNFFHISENQKQAASMFPKNFKPLINSNRRSYYKKICDRFNSLAIVKEEQQISDNEYKHCSKLSDFWQIVYSHVMKLHVASRQDIMQIYSLLSIIYNYPNCVMQMWTRNAELELIKCKINRFSSDKEHDFHNTFVNSLWKFVHRNLRTIYLRCHKIYKNNATPEYTPFIDIILYFKKVEKYYPILFKEDSFLSEQDNAINIEKKKRMLEEFIKSPIAQQTIFIQHAGKILPVIALDS
jgi:hypothetical protein